MIAPNQTATITSTSVKAEHAKRALRPPKTTFPIQFQSVHPKITCQRDSGTARSDLQTSENDECIISVQCLISRQSAISNLGIRITELLHLRGGIHVCPFSPKRHP